MFTACIRKTNGGCTTDTQCGTGEKCVSNECSPDTGSGGSQGQGGSGNGGALATGGDTAMGGDTATSGGSSGTGGESSANGGAVASGGAGGTTATGGSAGSSSGSSSGGAAGSGTGGSAPLTTEMIDDMEDGDGRIIEMNGRQGPWHTFNSGESTQMPAGPGITPESGGANGSKSAMHTSGKGFAYAGIGFDLNNADTTPESAQSKAYDASAWTGVVFIAKAGSTASAKPRVEIPMRDFVPGDRGGTCTNDCWNVYGYQLPDSLTSEWKEYKVPFSSLKREDGSTTPSFDSKQIMSISFKHQTDPFDFWIDDVRFYKE
jgi:hypothetical protein